MGYLKALPQELIATYGMGTGLSSCVSTGVMLSMVNFGIKTAYYYAGLGLILLPMFYCSFLWFEEHRQNHA